MLKEFQMFGRDLFLSGLNNSHSGNLSVRIDDKVLITRRGAMLGCLEENDLIETGLFSDDGNTTKASTELGVHRAIYRETAAAAIVHAHPVHAIALSLLVDEIIPIDAEGAYLFNRIPILKAAHTIGSEEVAEKLPVLLKENKIVVVGGHGSFATGQKLEQAYQWTTSLENICRVICLTMQVRGNILNANNHPEQN